MGHVMMDQANILVRCDHDNLAMSKKDASIKSYDSQCFVKITLYLPPSMIFFFYFYWLMQIVLLFRWALRESLGPAERRPATRFPEEPSQNCHLFVSQQ